MVKVSLNGLMVRNMKGITKMIRNMDLAFFNGKMVENMKDIGLMVNNMEKV